MNSDRRDIFVFSPEIQSLSAWKPFWDAAKVLFEFQNSDVADDGQELPEWRLFWVAGITLLRTIGHVLAKVDAENSGTHKKIIQEMWDSVKKNRNESRIFWEFVENERNNILKTYSFGAKLVHDSEGSFIEFEDGSDAFELFREAIYWWRDKLIELETNIKKENSINGSV